jgi:hypothetical protein
LEGCQEDKEGGVVQFHADRLVYWKNVQVFDEEQVLIQREGTSIMQLFDHFIHILDP